MHRPLGVRQVVIEYYPCYNMPHVDLVTSPIEAVTPTGIRTAEGERSVDTIILATGFETTRYASVVDYTGRGGVSLNTAWGDGAQAFLGISTAGFPNLFMLYGALFLSRARLPISGSLAQKLIVDRLLRT